MADATAGVREAQPARLYQQLARRIMTDLASGRYAVGDRLPAERELSIEHEVSRPTVREAFIALEVQGFLEVRIGAGAYVKRLPGQDDAPGFDVTAFELTEARLLIEGEAAALAASQIVDAELDELDRLVDTIADEDRDAEGAEHVDREFHLRIARATRNIAMVHVVEDLWRLRTTSPESALLHAKARAANGKPVIAEHRAIVAALRIRDPAAARAAMRAHLAAVLDHLLFATEEQAVEEVRRAAETTRARFFRATAI